jgi:hypothetical protein
MCVGVRVYVCVFVCARAVHAWANVCLCACVWFPRMADPDPTVLLPIVPTWYPTTIIVLGIVHIVLATIICIQHALNEPLEPLHAVQSWQDLNQFVPRFDVRLYYHTKETKRERVCVCVCVCVCV